MKLPDFEQFEPMNELRKCMGADELGSFESFDPNLQLTSLEVERLSTSFIDVPFDRLRRLPDDTIAYKNSRVLVFEKKSPDVKEIGTSIYEYHMAHCRHLRGESNRMFNRNQWVQVALTFTDPIKQSIEKISSSTPFDARPCWECLHALRMDGFDGEKHRKRIHSEHVWRTFEISKFIQDYTMYPLPEELWG